MRKTERKDVSKGKSGVCNSACMRARARLRSSKQAGMQVGLKNSSCATLRLCKACSRACDTRRCFKIGKESGFASGLRTNIWLARSSHHWSDLLFAVVIWFNGDANEEVSSQGTSSRCLDGWTSDLHIEPRRWHRLQIGKVSSHFTFRLLHSWQPVRLLHEAFEF